MSLKVGQKVPEFEAYNQDGERYTIKDILGKKNIVVYFYPKNFTKGCSKEAREFKISYQTFKYYDTEIIGISGDSPESHSKFEGQLEIPYTLLSDQNGELRKLFGVQRDGMGLLPGRETFVIDKKGILRMRFDQTKVLGHVEKALDFIRNLGNE